VTASGPGEELVDALDAQGNVVGTVTRAEMRRANLWHRSVFVVVVNDGDEILVHRRAGWKDKWPDRWDIAVGGVVIAGEAWEVAAGRELAEEVGVTAELVYLGEDLYVDDDVREVARIYQARTAGPFTFADGEITEAAWVPIAQLRDWAAGHEVCPDSMSVVLPRLDSP
jgi:isopentenyldiphosphate isomerase